MAKVRDIYVIDRMVKVRDIYVIGPHVDLSTIGSKITVVLVSYSTITVDSIAVLVIINRHER